MDATQGHALFERWLIRTYGASTRKGSLGRPAFSGMRDFRAELESAVHEISPKLDAIAQAGTIYHWLATAKPGTLRCPASHIRIAIERMSEGAVPADAWDQAVGGEAA